MSQAQRHESTWTHRTAVVFIPPPEVWPAIQAIRREHDRQFQRWMPHVTLLYPFAPRGELPQHLPRLREAAATQPAFPAHLTHFHTFKHRHGNRTVWLAPEPRESFRALQSALQSAAPAYAHVSRHAGGFTPHLSVGQTQGEEETQTLLQTLASTWHPVEFRVKEVALIAREGNGPFEVVERLPLGA